MPEDSELSNHSISVKEGKTPTVQDEKRYYFALSIRVIALCVTVALIVLSVGVTDGRLVLKTPPIFLVGIWFGILSCWMFAVPYLVFSEGRVKINLIFTKKFIRYDSIESTRIRDTSKIEIRKIDGKELNIPLILVSNSDIDELAKLLESISMLEK